MVPYRSEFKINQSGMTSEYFDPLQTHNTRHHTHTLCLMMGEVSPKTSPKNTMIQDMINSETIWIQLNRQTQTYSRSKPYKCFIQMAYNCGTPLIHILHAQNRYIKSWLLRQSFEFFSFLDRVILGKLLKNW